MQLNLKTILNLKEHHRHFVYHDVRLTHPTGITAPRIEVTIQPRQGSKGICSGCGKTCAGYDRLPERRFIHVPLWGIAVIFLYCMRRLACSTCGVTVEVVPWSSGKGPITLSYGWYLSEWAKVLSMQEVSVAAFFDGPLSKDFDGLPASASRALYGVCEAEVGSAASAGEMVAIVGFDDAPG